MRGLADLADAEAVLTSQGKEPVGRLKVDVPIASGRNQVLPLLLSFAERHPQLRPIISFTDRGRRYLGSERVIFCASPAYLERCGRPQSADDLSNYDCVLYGKADGSTSPGASGKASKRAS